jgi:hypothetical protein
VSVAEDERTDTAAGVDQVPSRLEELRAAFAKPLVEKRLFKRLPCEAAGGKLVAEYRVLKAGEVNETLDGTQVVGVASDTLIAALVMLHAHDPKDERADARGLVALHDWLGLSDGGSLGFDHRLADAFGLPKDESRAILLRLFDGNEIALITQCGELGDWTADTTQERYQDFSQGS